MEQNANIFIGLQSLIFNIIGGIIVALLTLAAQYFWKKRRYHLFKRLFGKDLEENFYIIYPAYESPQGVSYPKPPPRVPRPGYTTVNLTTINSTAASRTMSHIAYAIGKNSASHPHIKSDLETDEKMDISFISVGGLNNYKSLDVLESQDNSFLTFGGTPMTILSARSSNTMIHPESGFDYGIIIKINPSHNPSRTWLCCAGIAEWGTSGAAWWLSRYWKKISKKAKDRPFAIITRTRNGSDDSTELVHLFLSQEEVENAAQP
jgi:hypothetical protein